MSAMKRCAFRQIISTTVLEMPNASDRPRVAFDLGAMHNPPAIWVKGVAPMHRAAIVPQNEIANAPDMLPNEFWPIDEALQPRSG